MKNFFQCAGDNPALLHTSALNSHFGWARLVSRGVLPRITPRSLQRNCAYYIHPGAGEKSKIISEALLSAGLLFTVRGHSDRCDELRRSSCAFLIRSALKRGGIARREYSQLDFGKLLALVERCCQMPKPLSRAGASSAAAPASINSSASQGCHPRRAPGIFPRALSARASRCRPSPKSP